MWQRDWKRWQAERERGYQRGVFWRFARARSRNSRWGLRRRLTLMFAFVALAAVFITTWFTLGAVFNTLFANGQIAQNHGLMFRKGEIPWDAPQFAQAREAYGRITGTAFLAGTVSFVLAVLMAAFVTRILTRPLSALTDGAKRLEAGERGIRLKVPRSRDELRLLTEAFNGLVTGLERQEAWRRGLMADIAHDLRTPLSVLRSEIEAMQDGVSKADPAGLERLHAQVMLLSRLVSDLRTLSLAESGGTPLKKQTLELQRFLDGLVEAFRPRAKEAGLELGLQSVNPDLKASFDPEQITRVLNNLLDNAVRHAAGPLEVSATAEGSGVQIRVRDHGPGIPAEAKERVFERFYKADSSRTRKEGDPGGSGLGLSIARAIAEAHGGRLEVANHSQGGAVFTLHLP
ncbi:MAG: HAMP domain-containing protein [Thermaceae bacterium]|nr:HAMP domain-containing protein [Thermaceae bacterium]